MQKPPFDEYLAKDSAIVFDEPEKQEYAILDAEQMEAMLERQRDQRVHTHPLFGNYEEEDSSDESESKNEDDDEMNKHVGFLEEDISPQQTTTSFDMFKLAEQSEIPSHLDRLRLQQMKEETTKEKYMALQRLIERLSDVQDSAFMAYKALENLFTEEEDKSKEEEESQGIKHISEIPKSKMVEILVEKEKRQRSNSEGGILLPSFTTLAHDVPSFIPLPKGVISTNPSSTYVSGEEEIPSNEGWGEEQPETNAYAQYMNKMVFSFLKDNPFNVGDANNGDIHAQIWTCQNHTTGEIFGKFSAVQMLEWSKAGIFEPNLGIKHDVMAEFVPLLEFVVPSFIQSMPAEMTQYLHHPQAPMSNRGYRGGQRGGGPSVQRGGGNARGSQRGRGRELPPHLAPVNRFHEEQPRGGHRGRGRGVYRGKGRHQYRKDSEPLSYRKVSQDLFQSEEQQKPSSGDSETK